MKPPLWLKALVIALAIGVAMETAFLLWLGGRVAGVWLRLTNAEQAIEDLGGPSGAGSLTQRLADIESDLTALKGAREACEDKLAAVNARLTGLLGHMAGNGDGAAQAESIEALIDERLQQRTAMGPGGQRRWKPTLEELAERLQLTDRQRVQLGEVIDRSKDDIYNLLATQRADGTSVLDEVIAAVKDPTNLRKKGRRLLSEINTQKVPGADQTYLAALVDIQARAADTIQSSMSKNQIEAMRGMNVNLWGVNTGYTPFADLMRQIREGQR
ncbi:MAG: hypothetical protein PHU25_00690 [Deltaproteobacteria bacterium]|nr:hypothetical protein [Deltaproteobacteria bacterium]